jgi:hypothetical protein
LMMSATRDETPPSVKAECLDKQRSIAAHRLPSHYDDADSAHLSHCALAIRR